MIMNKRNRLSENCAAASAVILCAIISCSITGCGKNAQRSEAIETGTADINPGTESTETASDEETQEILIDGNTLVLNYDANPTTGFSWSYEISDESVIRLVKDDYVQDKAEEGMTGVGGKEKITFEGLKKGTAVITLTYAQQWKGGNKSETKYVTVETDEDGNIVSAS